MASGNLGDLFVSLGIKDEMSETLRKIVKGMKGVDQATLDAKKQGEDLIRSLNGLNGNNFSKVFRDATKYIEENSKGLSNIVSLLKKVEDKADQNAISSKFLGAKDLPKIAEYLTAINAEFAKMAKDEARADSIKAWQSRISNALEYIGILQNIDLWQNKIDRTKANNPNVNSKTLDNAKKSLSEIRSQIVGLLSSGGIDTSGTLSNFGKFLSIARKNVNEIISKFKEDNPLSAFSGGAAKVEADISRVTEKLAKLRDLMSEGTTKGYNTSMLGGNITELGNLLARLQSAQGNKNILTDEAQMKNLLSDVAVGMVKATSATQAYGREKGKVIAQEREWQNLANSGFRGGRFVTPGTKEAAQGYLDIANAYKKAVDTLQVKHGEASVKLTKILDEYNKEVKGLESKIKAISPKMDGLAWNGKKLSPKDLAAYEELIKQLEHLKNTKGADSILAQTQYDVEARKIQNLINLIKDYEQLAERVAKGTYKPYDANSYEQKRISETAALKNAIIERYKAEQDAAKKTAAEEAKATREANAAEKQRQSELEISRRRIQSMEKALSNLQEKRFTSKMLGLDTSEAEAKILNLKIQLSQLWELENKLFAKDMTAVGKLGNIGNGREVQAANDLARSYDRANKEAQKGIEIEQKRQAEIAKSAAKARNDLAAAFAGANAEAKKMQSVVGDIKSLFLQGGIVFGAQQFFNSIVQTGGEIVQQHVALRSILGDVAKADELFAQTQQLALQSPFKFGELNRDVKQLAAFGVEANDLYDTTKRLADIASGLGVSFERLGLAYGQVKARSWLDGKELRQFAYAGLPLLKRITELYNSTAKGGRTNYKESDVKEMITKRQVSFDDVKQVLWNMTDEGGQFYNMQLVLSDTLLGRWNKLIDAWDIMLGKFAEGKSVIGGTFSFVINRVTDLILAIDKLSPAMLSVGAIFSAKKLGDFAASRLTVGSLQKDYTAKLNAQLKSYAIEQQSLVTEGKITQEIAAQNVQKRAYILADATSLKASYSRAALEGRMSVLQMQRALKEGLIEKELIQELATMGAITAKQEQIILNGGKAAAVWNMAGSKFKSVFSAIGGWWTIGIAAIAQVASTVMGQLDEIKEKEKELLSSKADRANAYGEVLKSPIPSSDTMLQEQIEKMKEVLKTSGDYTKTIDEQVSKVKTLQEQYGVLKGAIENAMSKDVADSKIVAHAIGATGGLSQGLPFNDTIQENLEDLSDKMAEFQMQLSTLDENTKQKMESVANSILGPKYASESLADKIMELADRGGVSWSAFTQQMVRWNSKLGYSVTNLGNRAQGVTSAIEEIANDDVKRIISSMQKDMNLFGNDFRKFCAQQPDRFRRMLLDIMDDAKWLIPQINEQLYKLTGFRFTGGKNPGDTPLSSIQRQIYARLGGNQQQYDLLKSYIDDNSLYKTNNNLQQALSDLWQEKSAQEKIGNKNSEAGRKYKELWSATYKGTGYKFVPEGKKSNKIPKTKKDRKEDTLLKELQERLSSLKSARQMYQKYNTILSDEEAAKKTYEQFPEVKYLELKDYQVAVRKLLEGFNANTPERRKFKTSVYREVAEWLFSEKDKKEFDKKAADFTEFMNRLSSQWDLYKSLLEKTGDKSFAKSAFLDNFVIDDKAQELINEYNRVFKKDFRKQSLMYLSDGDAKGKLKGAGEYELWKKITELVRGNYTEALTNSADLIKEALSYEEQIVATREKYNKLIENVNKVGNKRAAVVARQQMEKEIGKINLDKFKNSSDYLNFYGAIVSLGQKKARSIAEQIRKNINEALQSGAIDAREYAKELKQLEEQLDKLSEVQPSFLHGGLNGIVSSKKNRGNDMFTQGYSQYDTAKEAYNLFQQLGNSDGMIGAQKGMAAGQSMMEGGQTLMKGAGEMEGAIAIIDTIIHGINDLVQGLNDTFQDVKDTAEALGADTSSDGWTDANSFFSGFSSASASATKGWDSLKNGDIGGVISGVVGSFTGWIKAFASGHDAKLDRQIKLAERQLTELKNMSSNISSVIEKTLGGIYSYQRSESTASKLSEIKKDYRAYDALAKTSLGKNLLGGKNLSHYSQDTYESVLKTDSNYSAYADQLALLHAQKDELIKQRNAEEDKKKSDSDKIADYNQQITEMELSINTFAQDFLKDIYSIDMKSWASELTDSVVGAWEKGEDAVDAYREKVKDMVKDVTKNIVAQKIMEMALSKPLDYLTGILEEKGQLDETDMDTLAGMLYDVGDKTIPQITGIFEALKKRGWDLRDNSGSASTTNSIKSITEETADLLASYVNQIRLDVSVNRENIKLIADAVTGLPELNVIAQSQLTAMNQLVSLAQYRNSKLDDMYSWMRSVTSGTGTKSISMK